MGTSEEYASHERAVVGNEAIAALAVPARYAILNHLLTNGPSTASDCAQVVGESPSNCSWHLRSLHKVGLVERVQGHHGDGRARPWQATAPGFDFSGDGTGAGKIAGRVLAGITAQHANELYERHLEQRDLLPEEWSEVSGSNTYALHMNHDELQELIDSIDTLLRPYVRPNRHAAPADSEVVHVTLRAFPLPKGNDGTS